MKEEQVREMMLLLHRYILLIVQQQDLQMDRKLLVHPRIYLSIQYLQL